MKPDDTYPPQVTDHVRRLRDTTQPSLYASSNTIVIVVITNVFAFARPITFVNTFGSRLRKARQLRRLTQAQLARACGLSQGAIGNYEADARRNPKDVFRIAEALNVEAAWLAMGTGPMEARAANRVADSVQPAAHGAWPFPGIEPSRVWALPEQQREILSRTLGSLLAVMENEGPDPHK